MKLPDTCVELPGGFFLHTDGKVRPIEPVLRNCRVHDSYANVSWEGDFDLAVRLYDYQTRSNP